MAAPTAVDWLIRWQWSWTGVLLTVILGGGHLLAWSRARRFDRGVSPMRLAWVTLALFLVLYVTCGPVGVHATTFLWVFALRIGLLSAVVPLGLALGKPFEVIAKAGSGGARGEHATPRWARGRVARTLMYPAVSSVLSAVSVLVVFFTGYGQAAATNGLVDAVLVVHMLFVGSLVVLPLLGEDLLPAWATPGVRTLIACLDGLLDALPGILVMTSSALLLPHFPGVSDVAARGGLSPQLDQKLAGGALLAVAESVGIPMLVAFFVEWMRDDERRAVETDRHLDELDDPDGDGPATPWWVRERDGGGPTSRAR